MFIRPQGGGNDPRHREGKRRVGPTSERPFDRYIPVSVRRAIRRRAGDTCEFPGCYHRAFLQFAHWRPHRHDSPREEADLLLLCHIHHLLVDAKFFAILGSPRDPTFIGPLGIVQDRACPGGRGPESDADPPAPLGMQVVSLGTRGPPVVGLGSLGRHPGVSQPRHAPARVRGELGAQITPAVVYAQGKDGSCVPWTLSASRYSLYEIAAELPPSAFEIARKIIE